MVDLLSRPSRRQGNKNRLMNITLIRHTSVDVPRGTCYGWTDVPVRSTFNEEAAATLRNLEPLKPFDAVFSSPLSRARKLAVACGYPTPILDDRLKEMNMGQWEMQRFDDIGKSDPRIEEWYADYMHVCTTGGESFVMLYERVANFMDELIGKPYNNVAIFAHGGVLLSAQIWAGEFPLDEHTYDHLTPYGGVVPLNFEQKRLPRIAAKKPEN